MKQIIILGGGHAAVTAVEAVEAAGYQAILVDYRNHVAGQLATSNHAWLLNGSTGEDCMQPIGLLKKRLYANCLDCTSAPLLLTHCAGLLVNGHQIGGIAIANSFGIFTLKADAVIDASEEQLAARHLLGQPAPYEATIEINLEINNAHAFIGTHLTLPSGTVSLHRTLKDGTLIVSATRKVEYRNDGTTLALAMRTLAISLLNEIRAASVAFSNSQLVHFGEVRLLSPQREVPSYDNLLVLPSQLSHEASTMDLQLLKHRIFVEIDEFCPLIQSHSTSCSYDLVSNGTFISYQDSNRCKLPFDPNLAIQNIDVKLENAAQYDTVITGGGTGGSAAMAALAEHGIHTLVIDTLPYLGGTTTAGGVSGAWHGYQQGAYKHYVDERNDREKNLHLSRFCAGVRVWDEILSNTDTRQHFLGNAVVCAVERQDSRITSVTVFSENGFQKITARIFIDTTGNAELCALSGIPTELGDDETGWIQSSSCWGIDPWTGCNWQSSHYGNDLDVVDPTDFKDVLRGLGVAHMVNSDFHISPLYTQREGRRIVGDYRLTIHDIATRQFRDDAIAVASCWLDTHGRLSSELLLYFANKSLHSPDNNEIHILLPLGTFRPQHTDNLLVAAKSISGERDATSLCRMNPDICNSGFAVGSVAAQFVTRNLQSLDDIELAAIRRDMHACGVLPYWAMHPLEPAWNADYAISCLDEGEGWLPSMMLPADVMIPKLKERLASDAPNANLTALALAWHGDATGESLLLSTLSTLMPKDLAEVQELNDIDFIALDYEGNAFSSKERSSYGFPLIDRLAPGAAYSIINRLIIALSHLDTEASMDAILPLAERAWTGGKTLRKGTSPYAIARKDSVQTYYHQRLWALVNFFRRRPTPRAIPSLERLLAMKYIGGNLVFDEWRKVPYLQLTYLEVMLADALMRCGSDAGRSRLNDFTHDARAIFRNMATRLLASKQQ